jgi:hypothetical protein
MAGKVLGPRRLANAGWLRYKARRHHRFTNAIRAGAESVLDEIELAYKSGYDGGLEKGKQRVRQELENGRSQRHQDFILLVQTFALRKDAETHRAVAHKVVSDAMEHEPPEDVPDGDRLVDYADDFVKYQYSNGERARPEWMK